MSRRILTQRSNELSDTPIGCAVECESMTPRLERDRCRQVRIGRHHHVGLTLDPRRERIDVFGRDPVRVVGHPHRTVLE
ncbi:hypothetical protein BJF84_24505 [Rhodococcus sp. CUA-806]|nr:hypothetical protein BJF84_24505 [Rhodococcus sp. CUA-806]